MYKLSIFFQYKIEDNILFILISDKSFQLSITWKESIDLQSFFNKVFGRAFSLRDYNNICRFKRSEKIFLFLVHIKAIFEVQKGSIEELLHWVKLTYNPSFLTNFLEQEQINSIYKKRFSIKENKKLVHQSWTILNLLKTRKTYRQYSYSKFDKRNMEYIFQCAYGNTFIEKNSWNIVPHKTVPSGWWFFSLLLFFIRFEESNVILYKFDWVQLKKLKNLWDKKVFLENAILKNPDLDFINASWLCIVFWNLKFSSKKYWPKALSLILLEWWHISQNFVLGCLEKKYWTCELWGVFERYLLKSCWFKDKQHIFVNAILFWKIQ